MKRVVVSTILMFFFCQLSVMAAEKSVYPPDIQRIKERGKLIVAMIDEDVPYFFNTTKEGQFVGHDVDLAKNIAEKLGVEVHFNRDYKTYDDVIDAIVSHEADIAISILSKTFSRSLKVKFSHPYLIVHPALVINRLRAAQASDGKNQKEKEQILRLLQKPGARISTLGGSSYVDYAQYDFPKSEIITIKTLDENWESVRKGEVLGFYYDEVELKTVLRRYPSYTIELETIIIDEIDDPVAVATAWENEHLLQFINFYLETDYPQPLTADDILDRYPDPELQNRINDAPREISPQEKRNVLIGATIFMVIFIGSWLYRRRC